MIETGDKEMSESMGKKKRNAAGYIIRLKVKNEMMFYKATCDYCTSNWS